MSRSDAYENDYLLLLFNNDTIAAIGDATGLVGSAADGSLYVSLHTSDPGEAGNQSTNEATFGAYARVAVARTVSGFTVSGSNASNAVEIGFLEAISGSETITHVGIGTDSSGAGNLLWSSVLTTSRAVSTGITLAFAIGELDINAD